MGEKEEFGVGTQYGGKGGTDSAPGQASVQQGELPRWGQGTSVLGGVRTPLVKGCFIPSRYAVSCASPLGALCSPAAHPRRRHCRMRSRSPWLCGTAPWTCLLLAFLRHFFEECRPFSQQLSEIYAKIAVQFLHCLKVARYASCYSLFISIEKHVYKLLTDLTLKICSRALELSKTTNTSVFSSP